nr:DUF2231 domain-containing protein [uncultured Sphingomonas sp.]
MILTQPGRSVWRQLVIGFVLLWAALVVLSASAAAHEGHKQQRQAQLAAQQRLQQQQQQAASAQMQQQQPEQQVSSAQMIPGEMHENMGEMMMTPTDRSEMSFFERLRTWLGAFHSIIVHFPIAFFPAALFTALVGRRRPAFSTPVQFLVVAGGVVAPFAALLGWLNAGFELIDPDPLLLAHRWLGTGIGLGGLALALWAWRRPWEDRGAGMILSLSVMTVAIAVQGWFGGSLIHGVAHLNW